MDIFPILSFIFIVLFWIASFVVIRKVFLKRKAQLIKHYEEKYSIEIEIPNKEFPEALGGSFRYRNYRLYIFNILEKGQPLTFWQRCRLETRIKLLGVWAMLFFIATPMVGLVLVFVGLGLVK